MPHGAAQVSETAPSETASRYFLGGVGMRAGFGTGWKWVQQNSFLLYDDRRVVHPSEAHSRPLPYVLRGRPPDNFDRD